MKGLIICKGKYGATDQYGQWLSNELQFPIADPGDVSVEMLEKCGTVIVGSSVYIGKLVVRDWLRRFEDILASRKVFFFIVCATPMDQKGKLAEIANNNIPASLTKANNIYFLPGRLVKKNLSFMDRFMLKIGAMLQKDEEEGKRMLQDFDGVKREYLQALILDVNSAREPVHV
ncbi:MAG TPA: flavodoxin domain-containing protein [Chitinophagaceae bacterium]